MNPLGALPPEITTRRVPFLDLRIADPDERRELLDAVDAVLQHGRLLLGPEVDRLENALAQRCNRRFAVSVGSGTDALYLALRALDIGPGHEVIAPALSWIATANAIRLTGATPVFADIRDDLTLDPDSVASLITPRTRAILPVHYTGRCCDMHPLQTLAEKHRLSIVEDAAQAFSARYYDQPAGSFGRLACLSMNPMKVFAACGEAGAILTDDPDLRERLLSLRYNGTVNRETCFEPSLNARLDTLQAAILLARLPRLDALIARRRAIAALYRRLLDSLVRTPDEPAHLHHVYYTFTIQADRRDELKLFLEDRGIETRIQHPRLMPNQPAYRPAIGRYPHAQNLVSRVLCLPAHEKLTDDDVETVAAAIRRFYRG